MNNININGKTIAIGKKIVIKNGRIVIDGNDVTPDAKDIHIEVHGNFETMKIDVCNSVTVAGSVTKIKTQSGDVHCGDVAGSVETMSGDVECGNVMGNVETMSGDITKR